MKSVQTVTRFMARIVVILQINTIGIKGNQCLWNRKLARSTFHYDREKKIETNLPDWL